MEQREADDRLASVMRKSSFSGRSDGASLLAERALALQPPAPDQAILDLGCGAGDLALMLKTSRPDAQVTGVDFSAVNIETARRRSDTVQFVCTDYLQWRGSRFSLIVADSVLQLIEGPLDKLAERIGADLKPGGLLVATVPDARLRNHLLLLSRRMYRLLPAGLVDPLATTVAKRLHPDLSLEAIRDRLPYMRMLPRLFGSNALQTFAKAGLQQEVNQAWFNPSLAKPHHRLMVWRRL